MDARFQSIYRDIYEARTSREVPRGLRSVYARMSLGAEDVDAVRTGIERGRSISFDRGLTLREDAEALLAINFQDMVMLLLREGGGVGPGELAEAVVSDIATLVERADPGWDARLTERAEISGHTIIEALSRSWNDLYVSRFRLWE
jgi:hypothetical protein